MKWAVYWDNPLAEATETLFFKTREAAMDKVDELQLGQVQPGINTEKPAFWDITLMKVEKEFK